MTARSPVQAYERLLKCEGKVVAVVGSGHLDGIEARWKREFPPINQ